MSCRWASALKMATNADKPDENWYSVVQELKEKDQKHGSRSFQNLRPTLSKDRNDKEKRKSSKSPARTSSVFDENSPKDTLGNKVKTLPRNFSAKDFSLHNF